MFLYHYYDASMKPFQNLSDISIEEARKVLKDIVLIGIMMEHMDLNGI